MNLDKLKALVARITWPQVGLLAVVVTGALYAVERLTPEQLDVLGTIVLGVLASLGLAVGGPMLRRGGDA